MEQFGVLTLGSRLKRLSDHLFTQVQEIYQLCDVPISSTYFPILRLLEETGRLSVVEIAEQLNLSHPAVSKQVTKILAVGLIEKTPDKEDQRKSLLHLSALGADAMTNIEPILTEMKIILDQATVFSSDSFMDALAAFENNLFTRSLAPKVLDRLGPYTITPLEPAHETAFYELNMAWLSKYFPDQITQYDREQLANPKQYLLANSASIWVAVREESTHQIVLGTIVLLPNTTKESGEILKLSVIEHCHGKGIAQTLLDKAIECARTAGMKKLTLETASCLSAAQHLYEKNGFITMQKPTKSQYERADIYMEKQL